MNEDEKVSFTIRTLEAEIPKYMKAPIGYEREVEFWIDKVITKSNYVEIIRANLDSAYNAALKIVNKS